MKRRVFMTNMTSLTASLVIVPSILSACSNGKFVLKKNQRIGCIGDSVTYSAGKGYVELLQSFFDKNHPKYNLKFINLGLNSETITGLTEEDHPGPRPFLFDRLANLFEENHLDVALFCYGINCGIYNPPSAKIFKKYELGITEFLKSATDYDVKIILMTPPPLAFSKPVSDIPYGWKNPYPHYDSEVVQKFRDIVLRTKHPSLLAKIDIYEPLSKNVAQAYDKDPIHPNRTGNEIIANTIIDTLRAQNL